MALTGITEPRLFTSPLRALTRETTRGYEVIDFARRAGEPLLPWQEWAAIHALELLPNGQFRFRVVLILVARQNGKSSLKRMVSLWRLYVDGARLILGVAQDTTQSLEQMNLCLSTIQGCPDLNAELAQVWRGSGTQSFALVSGARYKIAAATRQAGRGFSADELTIDELREQRDWAPWSALSKTTMARPRGQIWGMSNAGGDDSVVLNQLRDSALSSRDPNIGLFEWSAEDDCDLGDRAAWAQANPGLGITVDERAIESALGTDPPAVFRTEVLCQRVIAVDSAVDLTAWKACTDVAGSTGSQRERLAACLDVSPDGAHATLAIAAMMADGRVRVEVAAAWKGTDQARRDLPALLGRLKPAALVFYPTGPGGALAPLLRVQAGCLELTGAKVAEACQGLADLALARQLAHPGDPLLDAHIGGATRLAAADGWRFTRRGQGGHVDAAYAAAGAVYAALTLPPQRKVHAAFF